MNNASHYEWHMPLRGMCPDKQLLDCHAERAYHARLIAARLQRSISHW